MSLAMMQALKTPGLTQAERTIYAYLVGRANGARVCWPLIAEIQADLEIRSRHTVCDATGKLARLGLIKVKRHMRARNDYLILDPDGRLYDEPPDVQSGGRSNGHGAAAKPAPEAGISKLSTGLSTDRASDVQPTALQAALMCEIPHIRPPQGGAKNDTSDVQKTAQESSSKNLTRIKEEAAIAHDLAGKQGADPAPTLPPSSPRQEREPTAAEIEAARAASAAKVRALEATAPALADVLANLGSHLGNKAYAVGVRPLHSREAQLEAMAACRPKARHLSPADLAAARARAGIWVPIMAGAG